MTQFTRLIRDRCSLHISVVSAKFHCHLQRSAEEITASVLFIQNVSYLLCAYEIKHNIYFVSFSILHTSEKVIHGKRRL